MQNRFFIADADDWFSSDFSVPDTYDIIYIDPPYNTGSKLSYSDSRDDWYDFMYSKLSPARELMTDDGVIFISIDDSKLIELCEACDKIFGRKNRIAIMITHQSMRSNSKLVNIVHEYVVVYAKNRNKVPTMSIPRVDTDEGPELIEMQNAVRKAFQKGGRDAAIEMLKKKRNAYKNNHSGTSKWINNYRTVDDEGTIVYPKDLSVPGEPNSVHLEDIGLHLEPLATRKWSSPEKLRALAQDDMLVYLDGRPYEKQRLLDSKDSIQSLLPFYSRQGNEELKRLGMDGIFDTAKPPKMIEMFLACLLADKDTVKVLDFFGGCGTTARACFALNKRYGGYRFSFDVVQIQEEIREGTEPARITQERGIEPNVPEVMRAVTNAWIEKNLTDEDMEGAEDGRYSFEWYVLG